MLRTLVRSRPLLRAVHSRGYISRAALSTHVKKTIQSQSVSDFDELRERALLRHVISSSTEGDPESVTAAMDTFWDTFFHGEGTQEWQLRGAALDNAVRAKQPKIAMEIGAYCGYTAVRMGRLMPAGGRLISIEIDPLYAAIATKVARHIPAFGAVPRPLRALPRSAPRARRALPSPLNSEERARLRICARTRMRARRPSRRAERPLLLFVRRRARWWSTLA